MKHIVLFVTFVAFWSSISAQYQKPIVNAGLSEGTGTKSEVYTIECLGEVNMPSANLSWKPTLHNRNVRVKHSNPYEAIIDSIGAAKRKDASSFSESFIEVGSKAVNPVVGTNFEGNLNSGSSPLDNSIAISNGGWIVSVANSTIEYDDVNGTTTYYNELVSFLGDPTITNICDPVVLYDPSADRFILFAQECSGNSFNSQLLILFSQTNDPNDGWWYYKLTGNPLLNNSWFDYPKVAISTNELYITGNLFSNNGIFDQAIIYQIDKVDGYSGVTLDWQYWYNLSGSPFTLLAVSYGRDGTYGPGCYFVATNPASGSEIQLYDLTNDIGANPTINGYSIPTAPYSVTGYNASQLNSSVELDAGDCRALSGFYLDGIIHFVFHSDIGNAWWGINYNRLDVANLSNASSTFGLSGTFDYCYPAVASFGPNPNDKSVMVGFGRAGSSINPEIRVVNCDDNMVWSSSTLVKSSSSYAGYTGNPERWGDYTGICRKHNASNPTVWMSGMYAKTNNLWNTWIAEIGGATGVGVPEIKEQTTLFAHPNPFTESCQIEFLLAKATDLTIEVRSLEGRVVKRLFQGTGIRGENVFSFNKSNLSIGTYFLVIKSHDKIIAHEKIIVSK